MVIRAAVRANQPVTVPVNARRIDATAAEGVEIAMIYAIVALPLHVVKGALPAGIDHHRMQFHQLGQLPKPRMVLILMVRTHSNHPTQDQCHQLTNRNGSSEKGHR